MDHQSQQTDQSPRHVREMAAPDEQRRRLLIEYLRTVREACPSCRYELHNLTSARCPECGEPLLLRVGLETPKQAAFIAGIVGLAGGLGFSGLLLLYVGFIMLTGNFGPDLGDLLVLLVESLITGALLIGWIRLGRHLRRLDATPRWMLAAACYAVPIANMFIFLATVD